MNGGAVKNYEGKPDKESMLRYVQEEAKVWIGLPGQVGEMHAAAKEFVGAKDKAKALKKAEAAAGKLGADDAEHGKYYVKVMTKLAADGEFVTKETARLKKKNSLKRKRRLAGEGPGPSGSAGAGPSPPPP